MLIIVEGVDCSGKTTLVNQLHDFTGFKIHKYSYNGEGEIECGVTMSHLFGRFDHSEILDRCHFISNLIYGKVVDGYIHSKPIYDWYIHEVQDRLIQLNTIFLYCVADYEILVERFIAQHEGSYVKKDDLRHLLKGYDDFLRDELRLPYIILDSGKLNREEMFKQSLRDIFKLIEEKDKRREEYEISKHRSYSSS